MLRPRALLFAPLAWALQFLAGYVTIAICCARFGAGESELDAARRWVLGYAALAVLAMTLHGLRGLAAAWEARCAGSWGGMLDAVAAQQRFIGFTAFLLAVLGVLATLFSAAPVLVIRSCG